MALEWAKISKLDPKLLTMKKKNCKLDHFMVKLKKKVFHSSEGSIRRVKRQPAEQETFAQYTQTGGFTSMMHK